MNDDNKIRPTSTSLFDWCLTNDRQDILDEWDYRRNDELGLRPEDVSQGSNRKVFWKCKNGHCWCSILKNRVYNNSGCPYCANKKVLKGHNDLKTWCINNDREDILNAWDYKRNKDLSPEDVTYSSNIKVYWKLPDGKVKLETINHKTDKRLKKRA